MSVERARSMNLDGACNGLSPSPLPVVYKKWKFSELLEDPAVRERFDKVRKFFFLRESTYDIANRCNLRCDGCYYYEGEKQFAEENRDQLAWRTLMEAEKERGITYVVLAGAEPALSLDLLEACHEVIPLGCIATNGVQFIPETVDYQIHVSVWGNDDTSARLRRATHLLQKQMKNYARDPRAIFIYTFTRENIAESYQVVESLAAAGCKVSFNVFSSPRGYEGSLRHTEASLAKTRNAMIELHRSFPQHVIYSAYNAVAHTCNKGLHDLYGCSYPRMNSATEVGLGRSFRQYRADLNYDRQNACCVPDTDCADCRHYASGSAIVTARLYQHAVNPTAIRAWLDYVDTYLAVWVKGYQQSPKLVQQPVWPFLTDGV